MKATETSPEVVEYVPRTFLRDIPENFRFERGIINATSPIYVHEKSV